MKKVAKFTRKTLAVATVAVLTLYVGTIPQDMNWEEGMSSAGLVYAAGPKGGGSSHDSGSSHDHDDSSHTDDGHTDHDHDDSEHGDADDGHSSGGKGKGPKYRGGRSGSGSTKGRGGASQAVIEKIFETE